MASALRCRIVLVPVTRSTWGLYLKTPPVTAAAPAPTPAPPQPVTLQARLVRWSDKAADAWENLAKAEPRSWRGRTYALGKRLQDRIDDREWFLKSVPHLPPQAPTASSLPAPKPTVVLAATPPSTEQHPARLDPPPPPSGAHLAVSITAPRSVPPTTALDFVRRVADDGVGRHRYWFRVNCAIVPFTMVLGVLPGPNLPLFWNLYRCFSHWSATRGAEALSAVLRSTDVPVEGSDLLDNLAKEVAGPTGRVDDAAIDKVADHFQSPDLARTMRRVRFQVETLQSKNFEVPT